MYELIKHKRESGEHSKEEIQLIVNSFIDGSVPDYQIAAWLMAVYLNGMTNLETAFYTQSLTNSGKKVKFNNLNGPIVDKHSTGGVGDKVSLILGPILAACNCYVPMIVGRGLGHTGGTLDKLESISNYNGFLNVDKFGTPDLKHDLESFPWPWETNSVSEIALIHVLEHLGKETEIYFGIFKEIYRVCKHSSKVRIIVPHFRHQFFYDDPTHVRVVTPLGLQLFSKKFF